VCESSRVGSSQVGRELAPFCPTGLVEECVELCEANVAERPISLRIGRSDAVPSYLISDVFRIRQVLLNLVSNAIKFTHNGEVVIGLGWSDDTLSLTVRDTGIGIPPDRLMTLFDPFVQAESSTTRRFGGSGLGLAISQRLVQAMGGRIQVESTLGEGTSFTILLSLQQGEAPISTANANTPRQLSGRVLVAEDHPVNQLVIERLLRSWGLEVELTADGQAAVEAVQRSTWHQHFDVILLDLYMPRMDGRTACRRIRELTGPPDEKIPIFALTASIGPEVERACYEAGMDDVLSKPIQQDVLFAALSQVLAAPAEVLTSAG